MNNYSLFFESDLAKLYKKLDEINMFLKTAPEGRLSASKVAGRFYYSIWKDNKDFYMGKDIEHAAVFAKKDYYIKQKKEIVREIKAMEKYLKTHSDCLFDIYDKLPEYKRILTVPLILSEHQNVEKKVREWRNRECIYNSLYPENCVYSTLRGEKVRSKSEAMIANLLYQYQDYLDYRYEPQVVFKDGWTTCPDFNLIVFRTGLEYYYEHFGLMDDEDYRNKAFDKILRYNNHNAELMMSFEGRGFTLNIDYIERQLKKIL